LARTPYRTVGRQCSPIHPPVWRRALSPTSLKHLAPVHRAVASQGVNPVIRGDPKLPLSVGPARAAVARCRRGQPERLSLRVQCSSLVSLRQQQVRPLVLPRLPTRKSEDPLSFPISSPTCGCQKVPHEITRPPPRAGHVNPRRANSTAPDGFLVESTRVGRSWCRYRARLRDRLSPHDSSSV
jgi:hypothetical protein